MGRVARRDEAAFGYLVVAGIAKADGSTRAKIREVVLGLAAQISSGGKTRLKGSVIVICGEKWTAAGRRLRNVSGNFTLRVLVAPVPAGHVAMSHVIPLAKTWS